MSYKLLSLFDGSGGFPLAGSLCGIEPVAASEVEPYPIAVTKSRFPNMKHLGSVTDINGAEVEPVDIVTWGFPCQDVSVAGKRAGLKHEENGDDETTRSGLMFEALRIVEQMLEATKGHYPKFMVVENVPGLLSIDKGAGFRLCLDLIQSLGFIVDPNLLDAQYMGVPQRRKRVYIVCVNVGHILKKKTTLSDSIIAQLLTEILQINLTELLKVLGNEPKKSAVLGLRYYENGLRRRMKLFSLQKENHLQMLQTRLDEMQATYSNEQKDSGFNHGEDRTGTPTSTQGGTLSPDSKMEHLCMSIGQLLKTALDEGLQLTNESITSTWTKETIDQRICFYVRALLATQKLTIRLLQSLEKSNPTLLNYYEWALYTSTEMREFTNAGKKHDQSIGRMGWNDLLRDIECELRDCGVAIERYFRGERAGEILFEREGLRGYFETGRTPWESTSGHAEGSSGTDDREGSYGFPLGFRPENTRAYKETSTTLCNGTRPGFTTGVLYAEEPAPTLLAGQEPGVCYSIEHHPQDSRVKIAGDIHQTLSGNMTHDPSNGGLVLECYTIENHPADSRENIDESGKCQTLTGRMGTSGGNVPMVMEPKGYAMQAIGEYTDKDIASSLKQRDYKDATDLVVESAGVDCRNLSESPELYPTLQAKPNGGQSLNFSGAVRVRYIVRRLTPTECARLQGFPDTHGHPDKKETLTDEEYQFWLEVRNTHAAINGKQIKEYTKEQILTWYNKLHTDSSEYKMWGNGIALPCALYVMQGIANALNEELPWYLQ